MPSSERKIAANRNNAKKSTGPRSKEGREVSRRNALRHGLAIAIGSDPAFSEDIQKLALVMSRASGLRDVSENAREAAEAELDLLRIRKIRASQFTAIVGNPDAQSGAYAELAENLSKLERYERRAFSRRKHALQILTRGVLSLGWSAAVGRDDTT